MIAGSRVRRRRRAARVERTVALTGVNSKRSPLIVHYVNMMVEQ